MSFADDVISGNYGNKKKKKTFAEEVIGGTYVPYKAPKKEKSSIADDDPIYKRMLEDDGDDEKEERSWFRGGAFSDGYDFGDGIKTLLGTGADMYEDLAGGVLNIGEGVIDAGAYAVQGGAKLSKKLKESTASVPLLGGLTSLIPTDKADDISNSMEGFIKKDLVGDSGIDSLVGRIINPMSGLNDLVNGDFDRFNVFKPKDMYDTMTDDTHESNSLYGDKTDSLVQSAGQLAGTVGLQSVGVPWFVTTGVTSFGSGTEEAFNNDATFGEAGVSAAINAGADILTEKISGGISFGGKTLDQALTKQISQKISSKTVQKLTQLGIDVVGEGSEEVLASVISNVGKKLTYEDEKTWKEVMASDEALDEYLESFIGGAVLGGVGSVTNGFGGNTQDIAPVDNTAQIQGLQEQIQAKQQELNQVQDVREKQIIQEEIEILNQELTEATNAQQITSEEQLKQKQFTYEATENDTDIKKGVYESASKYMNDTKEAHDFVDTVAKIAEDRQTKYEFVNSEAIKEAGYSVENTTVNGLVTEDGKILINIDSPKALETVVGHETTHLLEGTQEYQALQDLVIEYAKQKGTYEDTKAKLYSLYQGTNADIDAEITSDLVGDLLFTDTKFVEQLSTKQPNVFKKIYEYIKHVYKMATAGSKEARQLEKIKRQFDKAYKAQGTQTATDAKYSISDNQGRTLTKEQQEYFKDSKVRDENGNLVKVYHGTNKAGFTEFSGGNRGVNFYTSDEDVAKSYFTTTSDSNSVYEGYANITNPLEIDVQNRKWSEIRRDFITDADILKLIDDDFGQKYNVFTTTDIVIAAKKSGKYDGVIFKNIYDNARSTKENLSTVYATFNSNQFKNIDNTKPTTDPDIRYSLSEEGEMVDNKGNKVKLEAAETGTHGTLMAIHNLTDFKLKGVLELGGFPVPSIAITKPTFDFTNYGEISVIFDKETINPTNKANEVYGSDVYSPRFPDTVNKVNEKALEQVAENIGIEWWRLNDYAEGNTKEGVADKLKYNEKVIDKYLESKNISVEPVYAKYSAEQSKVSTKFVENFLNTHEELKNNDINLREIDYDQYSDEVKQIYIDNLLEYGATIEDAQDLYSDFSKADVTKFLIDVKNFKKFDTESQIVDEYATKKAKEQHIDYNSQEYLNFIENLISPMFGDKYIRNTKDLFTPAGNRRSFNQLHDPYNLENVVKNMKGKVRGTEGFFYGAGNIRSQVTPQFKSIAEIKASENKLITHEQMEEVKRDINSDLNNLSVTARNFGGHSYDSYEQAINEIAGLKKITSDKTKSILNEYGFKDVPDILVQKSMEFLEKLKNAPTEYFEAKPQRAIGFDEVQAIVVPNDIDADLKQQLYDNGLNIIEYDPNIEGDRQAKINELDDLKFSLSAENEIAPVKNPNLTYGEDIKLQVQEAIAPLQEAVNNLTEQFNNLAPTDQETVETQGQDAFNNITDTDAPTIDVNNMSWEDVVSDVFAEDIDLTGENKTTSPFDSRDIDDVGKNRSVKAYQYENPEVRPYFKAEAENMLYDLDNTIKGERNFNDQVYYDSNGENGWYGTTRQTTEAIAYLKDKYGYSYDQIRQGLNDIIEDNGKENNAVAKRIEFMLDERLRDGYTTSDGIPIPPNEEYIKFLDEKQITEYNRETSSTLTDADVPVEAPESNISQETLKVDKLMPTQEEVAKTLISELSDTSVETQEKEQIAKILEEAPTKQNKKQRGWAKFRAAVFDKGSVFEDLSLKTKNREIMSKWDYMLTSESRAQNVMLEGVREFDKTTKAQKQISKGLHDIRAEVGDKVQPFSEYLYHKHNISRMSIESKAQARMQELLDTTLKGYDTETIEKLSRKRIPDGVDKASKSEQLKLDLQEVTNIVESAKEYVRLSKAKNKPVFGDSVTAEVSQKVVDEFEMNNPEFMDWANDVYDYNKATLNQLIKSGVISQETANTFAEMYPHYVPIGRANVNGNAINVPLDTNRTGINTPIKGAKGGNGDILPLFDTMAKRTIQTYKAVAKNNFGVELKNTLNSVVDNQATSVDEILDNVDQQESLLQQGENGKAPTFTVFENGEKVTYEITQDMYDALKPVSDSSILSTTFKPFNKISNFHRGVLTEYNPVFMLTNAIKDVQDILLNSQHATKTYSKLPESYAQILKKGYWYQEYMANGGEQNSYFDSQEGTFETERKGISKILDLPPLKQISQLNNIIEMSPRLAEYIASREAGRSIETSMLDAARVTTNFKAGGDVTKWANRNGATFLNASVQGAMQQVRNIREANAKGLKGYANLASKFALAGIPAMILNNLLWDDDEEYEELSDYVKQNYWIVGKYGDGNFIRIPKGRMITVVQEGLNQMVNLATGNDEADLSQFLDIVGNNIAPNNPIESNVLSPIIQAATNTTWYGDDLVPTRLQDEPVEEQFDESTDKFSIFLGQKLGISPYKINYVLDQYSGGVGDVVLPMMTQQAETGSDSVAEEILAPLTNKFTVDSVMKNQNVSDLYSLSEELTSKASSTSATDEDVLRNKYINSVKSDMNQLYKEKREIQSDTTLSNSEKYEQVREIQKEINEMAKNAVENSENVTVKSDYSKAGSKEYYKNNKGEWEAVDKDEIADLKEIGVTSTNEKNTYFKIKKKISSIEKENQENKKDSIYDEDSDEYKDYSKQLSSEQKKDIVDTLIDSGLEDKAKAYLYKKAYNSDTVDTIVSSGINVDDYLIYTTMEFKADYNSKGNAISGSRKNKVINYVNGLNLSIPQKAILIKSTNTFKFNDYNYDIVSYVDGLGIDYTEKVKILKDLDMTVKDDGSISW